MLGERQVSSVNTFPKSLVKEGGQVGVGEERPSDGE